MSMMAPHFIMCEVRVAEIEAGESNSKLKAAEQSWQDSSGRRRMILKDKAYNLLLLSGPPAWMNVELHVAMQSKAS
jgi:hypothetical protein